MGVRKIEEIKVSIREISRTYFNTYKPVINNFSDIIVTIEGVIHIKIFKKDTLLFTKDITIGPYEEIDYHSRIHQLEETLKEGEYTKWMP